MFVCLFVCSKDDSLPQLFYGAYGIYGYNPWPDFKNEIRRIIHLNNSFSKSVVMFLV